MKYTEEAHQKYVVQYFNLKYPHLEGLLYHIPNGQNVGVRAGYRLKKAGLVSGLPDLHIAIPTNEHPGLYIEMKSEKGRCTLRQSKMQAILRSVGYRVEVCHSWIEARDVIDDYLKGYVHEVDEKAGTELY